MHLATPERFQEFVKEHLGMDIDRETALSLRLSVENHILLKCERMNQGPKIPFVIPKNSRDMNNNIFEVLSERIDGKNRVQIFEVNDDWVGKESFYIDANLDPQFWDQRRTFIFLRKELWEGDILINEDLPQVKDLTSRFAQLSTIKPKESYEIDDFRRGVSRTVKERLGKRVKIMPNADLRETHPFLRVDDEEELQRENTILHEEIHVMKTFFKDQGEIQLWWNDTVWIFWTDWVVWYVEFQ